MILWMLMMITLGLAVRLKVMNVLLLNMVDVVEVAVAVVKVGCPVDLAQFAARTLHLINKMK